MAQAANEGEEVKGGAAGLWGGRFEGGVEKLVQRYTASIGTDVRLYRYEIAGSRAHARMLAAQGLLEAEAAGAILAGLDQVEREIGEGALPLRAELEDIHLHVEARLGELIGAEPAGQLHMGTVAQRSGGAGYAAVRAGGDRGGAGGGTGAAGERCCSWRSGRGRRRCRATRTCSGRSRCCWPIICWPMWRCWSGDGERLADAGRRADVLPLGSAALAGAAYALDREAVARELGFGAVSRNSIDAVSDRDYALEFLAAAAICMVHLSRLCEELVLWSSAEFGYLRWGAGYTTGSSIMPQKRNPDVAELARAKTGRVVGQLVSLLTLLKGLPLAYNRDLQEDKEALFDGAETLIGTLRVLAGALGEVSFDEERMRAALEGDPFILATDYADHLTRQGLPFREAHQVVGELVRRCEGEGRSLGELSLGELQAAHPSFGEEAVGLSVEQSLAARDVPGGTAPGRVAQALAEARARLEAAQGEGG